MEYLYNLLFTPNKKRYEVLAASHIKKLARRAGILYLPKNCYTSIRTMYDLKIAKTIEEISNLTKQRQGKIMKSIDLNNYIKNFQKMEGGSGEYLGWCDSQPGQCQDSLSLCGGGITSEYTSRINNNYKPGFLIPHKRFVNTFKKNKKNNYKVSKNLLNNLHLYVERYLNSVLIKANKNTTNITKLNKELEKFLIH